MQIGEIPLKRMHCIAMTANLRRSIEELIMLAFYPYERILGEVNKGEVNKIAEIRPRFLK